MRLTRPGSMNCCRLLDFPLAVGYHRYIAIGVSPNTIAARPNMQIPDDLRSLSNLPDIWGEGALFAFSGLDGETNTRSGLVGTLGRQSYDLLLHTPLRRMLRLRIAGETVPRIVTNDTLCVDALDGELVMTFQAWHTLIGQLPSVAELSLCAENGPEAIEQGGYYLSADLAHGDVLALARAGNRFALAYGATPAEACQRAAAGLAADLWAVVRARLAPYRALPVVDASQQRLLNKCFSVMRVNSLSAEDTIRQRWSTPDRVPHRDMWLWDTVFHSLAMNYFDPQASWEFLQSMLAAQSDDGMIAHQVHVSGKTSAITQPPILAWGVWENYQALQDKARLAYALPRLERYLDWDCAHRDTNGNGLLEWHIEGNVLCRSGESGMDNSPRFDGAVLLDAVDFSTFAAADMRYVSLIAAELGDADRAAHWLGRSRALSQQIHACLWDERQGFYCDLDMQGNLSPVMAASGFLPLLLEDIPAARVDRLVEALQDPRLFHCAFPVPSVSLSDPNWSTDMWRGATWLNLNYMIIRGLRQQGNEQAARDLADTTIAMVDKYYREYGVLFEFFDARDAVPPVACDRKGPHVEPYDIRRKMDSIRDYHFTAALTACLLLE
jgi:glycogen debranching enzyme